LAEAGLGIQRPSGQVLRMASGTKISRPRHTTRSPADLQF
jgi:hypothetical protein